MDLEGVLVPLGLFAAIVLSLFFYFSARNKERMALIEKGLINQVQKKPNNNMGLKFGSLFIGLSFGIFLGYLLAHYTTINQVVAYFSMILLFGGISLILNNFLPLKKKEVDN